MIRVCVPGAGTERSPRAAPISGIRDSQLLLGNILRRRSGLSPGVQRSRQHHGRRRRLKQLHGCLAPGTSKHRHARRWLDICTATGTANTGSICPTACRASGGDICEPGTGPRDDFVVMGILGRWIVIRTESSTKIVAPATRDQTDVRRIPAVRASQTPGFEKIVQDRAFFAQTDFQPIPLGSTQGESRAPGQMRARVSCVLSLIHI